MRQHKALEIIYTFIYCMCVCQALLYLIKLLDPIVRGDYVIAYFHTLASSNNHPPFSWLKEVYTVLPYK